MGLQSCRNRRVPVEHDHHVAGLVRPYRLGLRPQDAIQTACPTGGPKSRRWDLPRGARHGLVAEDFMKAVRLSVRVYIDKMFYICIDVLC